MWPCLVKDALIQLKTAHCVDIGVTMTKTAACLSVAPQWSYQSQIIWCRARSLPHLHGCARVEDNVHFGARSWSMESSRNDRCLLRLLQGWSIWSSNMAAIVFQCQRELCIDWWTSLQTLSDSSHMLAGEGMRAIAVL